MSLPISGITNIDIKRPTITSVAVNLTPQATVWPSTEGNGSRKKCTTVVLNNDNNDEKSIDTTNERNATTEGTTGKENSFKITTTVCTLPKLTQESNKHESYKPVKVIHHNCGHLPEKQVTTANSKNKEEFSKTRLSKTLSDSSTATNGSSVRRKITHNKHRLWDSGRDSWLNLPKDRKAMSERQGYTEYAKIQPMQKISRVTANENAPKAVQSEGQCNGFTDTSCEDDAYRRSSYRNKQFTKPMTTISEKASLQMNGETKRGLHKWPSSNQHRVPVTRTTSNSSFESHSDSLEFRTPVLKTEERSRRRAERLTQRVSNREALVNAKSSSEDITSENEVNRLRSSKVKSPRKTKIPKTRTEQVALLEKPKVNR